MRVPKGTPKDDKAPKALNNAAAVLEKAKQDEAVAAYKQLADSYPQSDAPGAIHPQRASREHRLPTGRGPYEQPGRYPQNSHAATRPLLWACCARA